MLMADDNGTALLTDPSATDDQRSERIRELRARYLTDLRTARKTRLPQDDGEQDEIQLLSAYLSGHGSVINGNALS